MESSTPEGHPPFAHLGFLLSMVGKGLLGLSQILGGLFLAVAPPGSVSAIVRWLSQFELIEDPGDPFVAHVQRLVEATPINNEAFYTVYLMIHGVLNLGLVLALLVGFRWAYPGSIVALIGFILYQAWKYVHTYDPMMIMLTAIDIVVIWLIWREWTVRAQMHTLK
jgi:uncharacterized membrane protein